MRIYYRNGKLLAEENYRDGKLQGGREYDENGTLETEWDNKNGKQGGRLSRNRGEQLQGILG